jgi:hypothetical protein
LGTDLFSEIEFEWLFGIWIDRKTLSRFERIPKVISTSFYNGNS